MYCYEHFELTKILIVRPDPMFLLQKSGKEFKGEIRNVKFISELNCKTNYCRGGATEQLYYERQTELRDTTSPNNVKKNRLHAFSTLQYKNDH